MERKAFLKSVWAVACACFVPFSGKAVGELVEIPLETQNPMTYGDWREMSWTRWCKCRILPTKLERYALRYNKTYDDFDQIKLNLKSPIEVPDGVYECEYKGYPSTIEYSKQIKRKRNGIVIKNGHFVPEPTARTIEKLILEVKQVQPPCDHKFIEGMHWNGSHFKLQTGS